MALITLIHTFLYLQITRPIYQKNNIDIKNSEYYKKKEHSINKKKLKKTKLM